MHKESPNLKQQIINAEVQEREISGKIRKALDNNGLAKTIVDEVRIQGDVEIDTIGQDFFRILTQTYRDMSKILWQKS